MEIAEEVVELVRTVAGLPREDQNRILRLVDLLSLAPYAVQQRAQALLRELIDAHPQSKPECIANVDELIEYLERSVAGSEERVASWSDLHHYVVRGTTQ